MNRTLLTCCLSAALVATAAQAAPAAEPPETVEINVQASHPDVQGLPADTKAVSGFSHRAHAETYLPGLQAFSRFPYEDGFTCAACHHDAATPGEAGSCLSCKTADAMLAKVGGPAKVKNLYHDTCKACHRAMAKAGRDTGPTRCNGCHGK